MTGFQSPPEKTKRRAWVVRRRMRIISSIVAVVILASLFLAFQIWREVDPHFGSRDQIVVPIAFTLYLTGGIAALAAIAFARKRRPVAVGFAVYAMLHGSGWLFFMWRGRGSHMPDPFDVAAGISICVGLRALMM